MMHFELPLEQLLAAFGERLQLDAPLASLTTARVGGRAAALLTVTNREELLTATQALWKLEVPFTLLGSGSNVLVSDAGVSGLVIHNRSNAYRFDESDELPTVWAESGANLGALARQAAQRGLGGLEWASTIPGSVGAAVYGNAGAHGGDVSGCLVLAEILHPVNGIENWTCDRLQYGYRTSALKRSAEKWVILSARMQLSRGNREEIQSRIEEFSRNRRRTQPPGASLGSMFKNPPGDYAGRLIEAAGLKGCRVGGVEISQVHANFFVNDEKATANDFWELICKVREQVKAQFGVDLELEIERIGDWENSGIQNERRAS